MRDKAEILVCLTKRSLPSLICLLPLCLRKKQTKRTEKCRRTGGERKTDRNGELESEGRYGFALPSTLTKYLMGGCGGNGGWAEARGENRGSISFGRAQNVQGIRGDSGGQGATRVSTVLEVNYSSN